MRQKVCIIGSGLTSLIASLVLSKCDLSIDLFLEEKTPDSFKRKNGRSIAFSKNSFDFLSNYNFLNQKTKMFWPVNQIILYYEQNYKPKEILRFEDDTLMYVSKYNSILSFLKKKIYQEGQINIIKNKLSEKNIFNLINGKNKYFYNLVLNCTNINSKVKNENFNSSILDTKYNETAVSIFLKHNIRNDCCVAKQIFLNEGPLALLPISNSETSIVWSINNQYLKKTEKENSNIIRKKLLKILKPFFKYYKIEKINYHSLSFKLADNYYFKRVLNMGDNLHTIHPFMGQGFNMTLRDLEDLTTIIRKKISLGLDVGDELTMREFEKNRKPQNFMFSISSNFIKKFFSTNNQTFKNITKYGFNLINYNSSLKNFFIQMANKGLNF